MEPAISAKAAVWMALTRRTAAGRRSTGMAAASGMVSASLQIGSTTGARSLPGSVRLDPAGKDRRDSRGICRAASVVTRAYGVITTFSTPSRRLLKMR